MMSSVRSCSGLTIHINVYCIGICCSQHVCYYCCSIFIISQASCGFCEFRVRTDVEGIKYVINFDYPNSSEDYIHRIGRTGRSDSTGTSYAFFTPNNFRQAKDLVSVLKEANQVINPKLSEMASRCGNFNGKSRWGGGGGNGGGYGGGFRGRENAGPRQNRFGAGKPAYRSANAYSNGNSYNNRDF